MNYFEKWVLSALLRMLKISKLDITELLVLVVK